MLAATLVATGRLHYGVVPDPAPGPDELLVRVLATGICGSDLATFRGAHPYKVPPVILGHEFCGVVARTGARVRRFRPGELVCSASFASCGTCPSCAGGRANLCPAKRNLCHLGWDGTFAEYVVLREQMTFALPDGLDPEIGALAEPLSIAVHAVSMLGPPAGRRLAILGSGSIGLSCLLAARRVGFSSVACADLGPRKGELASALGADAYIDAAQDGHIAHAAEVLGEADAAIVASGHRGVLDEAAALTRPGGTVVVVSYFDRPHEVALNSLVSRELAVRFSLLSTPADFRLAIGWLARGEISPRPLITHRLPLAQAAEAMSLMSGGQAGKIILRVGE
jgi:threonine dehydrogenase-like Zn-dependent dehydrogenase